MENSYIKISPHPRFLELLFTFKSESFRVFGDVLGLHEIDHVAVTRINSDGELLAFSSTPALEFNLFKNNLWLFDKSYHPEWFYHCTQSEWQALYIPERYDELYYIKQIKHQYPLGFALSKKIDDTYFIYSLASSRDCDATRESFISHFDDFYRIGEYCSSRLTHLFQSENL
ncbi:hypothetical protein [Legionella brunensis]|uniref:Putative FlgJ-like protein n=1 Tax=Legionella brunensis TaxID=29422 RepID=A0A0W0SPI4_9GAMM|nr:hypothetical protein [Legionella brunensis]KTC85129.1 putative FlgJ-like protein [Legionella brunensis]